MPPSTLCELLMGCPSFTHHRRAAQWALHGAAGGDDGNAAVPEPLAEILAEAHATGVSALDRTALCIAYAHKLPARSTRGGVKVPTTDARKIEAIVTSIADGTQAWQSIRLESLDPDVVRASIDAVFERYDANSDRAAAVARNLSAWAL